MRAGRTIHAPKTGSDLLTILENVRISEETLDSIEAQIRARRESPARIVELWSTWIRPSGRMSYSK